MPEQAEDDLPLPMAAEGDTLSADDLSAAVAYANGRADELNALLAEAQRNTSSAPELKIELRRQRDEFRLKALQLSGQGIRLQAGQARIGAQHIASAVAAAQARIDAVADVNAKLKKLGAVLDLLAALLTGQGKAIVDSARKLKDALG